MVSRASMASVLMCFYFSEFFKIYKTFWPMKGAQSQRVGARLWENEAGPRAHLLEWILNPEMANKSPEKVGGQKRTDIFWKGEVFTERSSSLTALEMAGQNWIFVGSGGGVRTAKPAFTPRPGFDFFLNVLELLPNVILTNACRSGAPGPDFEERFTCRRSLA